MDWNTFWYPLRLAVETTDYVKDSETAQPMQALTLVDFGISLEVLDPKARELPDELRDLTTDKSVFLANHCGGPQI
jgi:hypothetical protein